MSRYHMILAAVAAAALSLAADGPLQAQQRHIFSVNFLGGVGGVLDADPSPGFANLDLQLGFSFEAERNTLVRMRLGTVDYGDGQIGTLSSPELTYLTVAGEYRYHEGYYDSGLFIGLGLYELEGFVLDEAVSDSSLGLNFGVTGEFQASDRFGVLLELSGHYANFADVEFFVMVDIGLAYHF